VVLIDDFVLFSFFIRHCKYDVMALLLARKLYLSAMLAGGTSTNIAI